MKECLLCQRDMFKSKNNFGTNCLKKVYKILNLKMPRTQKEEFLYNQIMKKYGKENLNENQKIMLTDRELTLQYLNKVPLKSYENYRKCLITDIQLINNKTKKENLKSYNSISLREAEQLYKIYMKYQKIFDKFENGKYDLEQNLLFDAINFSFNKYYAKKGFLLDGIQLLQYGIFQMAVIRIICQKV